MDSSVPTVTGSKTSKRGFCGNSHGRRTWPYAAAASGRWNTFLKTLSALFLGFWGNGASRTWCAQTFLPFCRELLCGEEIWNATKARSVDPSDWEEVLDDFFTLFDSSTHRFLARSGESLYLQICNALTQTQDEVVEEMLSRPGISLSAAETAPLLLKESPCKALASFFDATPVALRNKS